MKHNIKVLLVVILVMLSFFASNVKQYTGSIPTDVNVEITDVKCDWKGEYFEACGTFKWNGLKDYYAKGFITNGQKLSESIKQTESPFTYCQNVGTREGFRGISVYIFDKEGVLRFIQEGKDAECSRNQATNIYKKQISFRIEPKNTNGKGDLILEIETPIKPSSCEISGEWVTDNNPLNGIRRYCDRASGSFTGYVDRYNQYVENDANSFRWAGPAQSEFNPIIEKSNGYIINMYTCDNQYYRTDGRGRRYYVRGRVIDFSKNMKIHWEYYNDDTHPAVDFIFDISCKGKA